MVKATEKQEKFVHNYLRTRAKSNRIPGTKDVIIADCTQENVDWLRSMRRRRRGTMDDVQIVADFCKAKLDLANTDAVAEYGYQCLPLCVIDAVFSIGVTYASTRKVVERFCHYCSDHLDVHCNGMSSGSSKNSEASEYLSIERLVKCYDRLGYERMAEEVFQNRQRTSTRNGILKSEAVLRFALVLRDFRVGRFQDASSIIDNPEFEERMQRIPGQSSGISTLYFYMLCGSEGHIKPDRRISAFILSAIGREPTLQESSDLLIGACKLLVKDYPQLTPRKLDNLIWIYQQPQSPRTC